MLELFRVKNFMSFKDSSILDFRALSYKQHKSHIIFPDNPTPDANYGILKTIAIYGANASGKSNLIKAMYSFRSYILDQIFDRRNNDSTPKMDIEPFALSDQDDTSEFEIVFRHNGHRFQYGIELKDNEIINEWYDIDGITVFDRNKEKITLGSKYQKLLKMFDKVPSNRPYISLLDFFGDKEVRQGITNDFVDFFDSCFHVFYEINLESSVKQRFVLPIEGRILDDVGFRNAVEKYIKRIDVGIERLDVVPERVTDKHTNEQKEKMKLTAVHNIFDERGHVIGEKQFDLSKESSGTLRFIQYIQSILEIQEKGGIFIIDELSARLHPMLTKLIVDLFQATENNEAQLVFSTHDLSLLNKNQFRRDEVVFVDKNDRGESKIYSLADLKVREDSSFSKEYIQGKYGAIPIFRNYTRGDENYA